MERGVAATATGPVGRLKRVGLLSAMALATLNAWTGSPLMAVWVGSRVQGSGPPQMGPIFVVAVTMGVISFALVKLLRVLGNAYDRLTGRTPSIRAHTPWLRSMRDGRPHETAGDTTMSALDIVLVCSVLMAVVAFEIWFFFFSPSPIDGRSGR
jgi:hypothetical protein